MNTQTIARNIMKQADVPVSSDDVTVTENGYTVTRLLRTEALHVARVILGAFADDPEAGLPTVAVVNYPGADTYSYGVTVSVTR